MYSIVNGIQVIKMYGWEIAFQQAIKKIRQDEIKAIAKSFYIKATLMSIEIITSIAVFVTLVTYIYMGNSITSQKAFVTIAYFNYVNRTLVHFWPTAITSVAEGWTSLKRVEAFLKKETPKTEEIHDITISSSALSPGIILKDATACWNNDNIGIHSIDIEIGSKSLVAIVGHVGCGKTTLLETILKEIPLISGSLTVKGSLSYAAQQAWIFEGSVKSNVLFTEPFDEKRYKKVLHVCALERDLELFPHGDETIVGERGVSLSGGQKARVNLARAIYKKADIYMLDDPLSAVDAHVGTHIFEKCIKEFLKDKVTVLVTHQVQYLKDVENVIVLSGGRRSTSKTFEILEQIEGLGLKEDDDEKSVEKQPRENPKAANENDEQKVTKETQEKGEVTTDIYKTYFKAVRNPFIIALVAFLFIGTQVFFSGINFFVSIW